MRRSLGKMSKRTRLLGLSTERLTVNKLMKTFAIGDDVVLNLQSRYEGMPHPRYRGRHGKVMSTRGRAYIVRIRDGRMLKDLTITSMHLEPASTHTTKLSGKSA